MREQNASPASREGALEAACNCCGAGFNRCEKVPEARGQQACAFIPGGTRTFESDADEGGHGGLRSKDGLGQLAKFAR